MIRGPHVSPAWTHFHRSNWWTLRIIYMTTFDLWMKKEHNVCYVSFHLVQGAGMFLFSGYNCSQASETCCDTLFFWETTTFCCSFVFVTYVAVEGRGLKVGCFFGAYLLSTTRPRQKMSPVVKLRSLSSVGSRLLTALTALMFGGTPFHRIGVLLVLQPPLLPECWPN